MCHYSRFEACLVHRNKENHCPVGLADCHYLTSQGSCRQSTSRLS
ncbi:hypothetical protein LINPERPRIM_LOCUS16374 [Linum perenne]